MKQSRPSGAWRSWARPDWRVHRIASVRVATAKKVMIGSHAIGSCTNNTDMNVEVLPNNSMCEGTRLATWQDAAKLLGDAPSDAAALDLWRVKRTMAGTLAYGLHRLQLCRSPLCIWVVGAWEETEGDLARHKLLIEVVTNLCSTSALEIWLIGPEMQGAWELEACGCVVRAYCGTLHSMLEDRDVQSKCGLPDVAVLFNSGIGTLVNELVESWLPSLSCLLAKDVPVILTCFNANEVEGQRRLLQQCFKANVLIASHENPFAAALPLSHHTRRHLGTTARAQMINTYIEAVRGSRLSATCLVSETLLREAHSLLSRIPLAVAGGALVSSERAAQYKGDLGHT